jgi:hypothetical protein
VLEEISRHLPVWNLKDISHVTRMLIDRLVNCHEEEPSFACKPQREKLDGTYEDRIIMKYLRLKYANWKVRGLGYK